MNIDHLAHDIFLLMLNLSQFSDVDLILNIFQDAMNDAQPEFRFHHMTEKSQSLPNAKTVKIATRRHTFGQLVLEQIIDTPTAKIEGLLHNALQMLALVFENRAQAHLLASENLRLEQTVKTRTAALQQANVQLDEEVGVRTRTEQTLREREHFINRVIETTPALVYIYDVIAQRNVYTNLGALRMLGYSPEQVKAFGAGLSGSIFHPEDMPAILAHHQQFDHVPDGDMREIEYRVQHANGQWRVFHSWDVVFERLPDGHVKQIAGSAFDVTERRQVEKQVRHLQSLLQNITDSMPSVLITLNADNIVLNWNQAAVDLTGKQIEQVQGLPLWQVCPELNIYQAMVAEVLCKQHIVRRNREPVDQDDGLHYRDVVAFPLTESNVMGVVLRIDDVTQRVHLEEMMFQTSKLASVGGLAAGVAHEINNPLGAILQGTQIIERVFDTQNARSKRMMVECGVKPESLQRYLNKRQLDEYVTGIRQAGTRAAKIVTDLLSFSRKKTSDFAPRNLNVLLEKTLDLAQNDYDLKSHYDFRNIDIVQDFSELPEVICDGQQIQQVILNLVRNAAQAMFEKRQAQPNYHPMLTLRTTKNKATVRLEIEDNGPGIPKLAKERLFQPFFTTKDVGKGTGLGLWVCWSIIVERHKGQIRVDSEPDQGTRFVIELPYHPSDYSAATAASPTKPVPA